VHLTDFFIGLIAYVVYFQKTVSVKHPSYEQVKADISRLLTESETCLTKGVFSQEDYDQARFVICAWIDEVILVSKWNQKDKWQREQLQRIYYSTTDAGEEVFERLNNIGLHQKDVREVYYLCLSLGFTGRYCNKGDESLLDQLKTSNLKLLIGSSVGIPSIEKNELFPESQPVGHIEKLTKKRKFSFSVTTVIGMAIPIIFFAALMLIYKFILSQVGENLFRTGQ